MPKQGLKSRPKPYDPSETEALALRQAGSGQVDKAVETLSGVLLRHPTRTQTVRALAKVLVEANRMEEAADALIVLKTHVPAEAAVRQTLGIVLATMRQFPMAEEELVEALRLNPNDITARVALAQVYEQTGEDEKAIATIQKAVQQKPENLNLTCHCASLLHHAGRQAELRTLLHDAPPSVADSPEVRLVSSMLMPIISESVEEIRACRGRLAETLTALRDSNEMILSPEETVMATNFHLGYHGMEDRELIELCASTQAALTPSLNYLSDRLERPPIGNRKLTVGFLSSNMRKHSVGRVLNRFLKELDRERFHVILFELPGKYGGGQETARGWADQTVTLTNRLDKARKAVEKFSPDILVIPDFVLDPFNDYLAFSRLAPVQCSTWGHPGTSGRPSMDYWISCEDWEPDGNERLYTEKLVRFTNPPMIATRLTPPETLLTRDELGLPPGNLYGCPQSLYKVHPEFDPYLAEVLRRDPTGHVVLIGGIQPHWINVFKRRFERAHSDVADRLVLLPNLATDRYLSLLAHCAVSMDPIHFGGANTSMEAFTMGTPVVTLPGGQLRNRQTLSFYKMMDWEALVVNDFESYIDLCLRLANEHDMRAEHSKVVKERCDVLFDTVDVTRQLETFFVAAATEAIGA